MWLYQTGYDQLEIIGVHCNQFGKQEPGDADRIYSFYERNFGVTFTRTEKTEVKGDDQYVLYPWLTNKAYNGLKNSFVKWNFKKYLIDEQLHLIDSYFSLTKPVSKKILKQLDKVSQ